MLTAHTVQLWFCPLTSLDEDIHNLGLLRALLSDDELAKVDRYRLPQSRLQALYVRSYLRVVLTHHARELNFDIAPDQWRFRYEPKGKPHLCDEQQALTGIEFNISHSGQFLLVAIVISDSKNDKAQKHGALQLGVDIEKSRVGTDINSIHHHYFSSHESSRLLALDESEQRNHFFDLWALKESYIKAVGKGLSIPLDSFSFDLSDTFEAQIPLNTLDRIEDKPMPPATEVSLIKGIEFERSIEECANPLHSLGWFSCLGRLNDEYRYAVTLGAAMSEGEINNIPTVEVRSNWLCSSQILGF